MALKAQSLGQPRTPKYFASGCACSRSISGFGVGSGFETRSTQKQYQSTLTKLARELFNKLDIELAENGLRNSYASYGLSFRSLGDVAKATGDLESTLKRFYIHPLEPGVGRAWFDIRPGLEDKIIPIKAAI